MGRKFGINRFLYHAVHLQFFQLLVDDAGAGILKMPVQFTGTFAAFLQFVEDARFPLAAHDFHGYGHTAIQV